MISEFFNGKALNKSLNPDTAVAKGATLLAGKLSGNQVEAISQRKFVDVVPETLGISAVE